jgi:zinc/manganese transport system substrate-binding protein
MMTPSRRAVVLGLAAAACARPQPAPKLVATFSILEDFVRILAGDAAETVAIVGPDADAHVYEPTPAHAALISDAVLTVENGLGFEPWMARLRNTGANARATCVAARAVAPLMRGGVPDPHAWHDAANARLYVSEIATALVAALPHAAPDIEARRAAYDAELLVLDRDIRRRLGAIPPKRRIVVTSHDAFGYFERAYGVRFLAPLGLMTEEDARPNRVAALIDQIRRENVRAFFLENMADPRLIERVADETGARLGGKLCSDALTGPDGPAPTYEQLMRTNVEAIVAALA